MASVQVSSLSKSFGDTSVLRDITMRVEHGEFVSIVGPSGCGKSTLLRIIAGLEQQTSGEVSIGDTPVGNTRPADRNLAMVFQSYALYPHLTVFDNMAVPLRMRELNGFQRLPFGHWLPGSRKRHRNIRDSVEQAAQQLQLEHLLQRKPKQLSGGQMQRVALGRALVRNPAAFLLDEPLSNLDAALRVHTRAEIAQLQQQLGATFIYVTHDQSEAMSMSDRIAVLQHGRLAQFDTPENIYQQPANLAVARFIGSPEINCLPVQVDDSGRVLWQGTQLPLTVAPDCREATLAFRSETIMRTAAGGEFSGTVRHLEYLGHEATVAVAMAGLEAPLQWRVGADQLHRLQPGEGITFTLDWTGCHLFAGDAEDSLDLPGSLHSSPEAGSPESNPADKVRANQRLTVTSYLSLDQKIALHA